MSKVTFDDLAVGDLIQFIMADSATYVAVFLGPKESQQTHYSFSYMYTISKSLGATKLVLGLDFHIDQAFHDVCVLASACAPLTQVT